MGDGYVWVGVCVAALFVEGGFAIFRQLAVAFTIELAVYRVVKARVSRPRPFVAMPSVRMLLAPPDEFSFPSGHTAAACVILVVLGTASNFLILPLMTVVAVIGISRVYLGVHYPTDVLAGAVLGSVSGWVGTVLA